MNLKYILLVVMIFGVVSASGKVWELSSFAYMECDAVSQNLVHQINECNLTSFVENPITINSSVIFNLADGVRPTGVSIWQNYSHTLYHDVSTSINHSVNIDHPYSIVTTTGACDWGAGNIKRNVTMNASNSSSTIYCFDSYINNSNHYTLYSVWNESVSTPYQSSFYDWKDITDKLDVSQFGTYKVGTIEADWTYGQTRRIQFRYDTAPNSKGKFDIAFHFGSAQQAKNNPELIKLYMDPWWNSSYSVAWDITPSGVAYSAGARIPIILNSTVINYSLVNQTSMAFATGTTALNFCVLLWNDTGNSYVMVKTSADNGSNITLYGNSSVQADVSNCSGTYDNFAQFGGASLPSGWVQLYGTGYNLSDSYYFNNYDNSQLIKNVSLNTSITSDSVISWNCTTADRSIFFGIKNTTIRYVIQTGESGMAVGVRTNNTSLVAMPVNSQTLNGSINLAKNKQDVFTYKISSSTTGVGYADFLYVGALTFPELIGQSHTYFAGTGTQVQAVRVFKYGEREYRPSDPNMTFSAMYFGTPVITFVSQSPADISSTNLFAIKANFTFNISNSNSTPLLFFKTNTTTSDISYFVNGTSVEGYQNSTCTNQTVLTGTITWLCQADDNDLYPATYNFNQDYMEATAKSTQALGNSNAYMKMQFFNVSNTRQYSFLELYANNTTATTQPLRIYYCNSSYTANDPATSTNCTLFFSLTAGTPYNHSHGTTEFDFVIPLGLNNATGKIGNVTVTPTSYIMLRGTTGAGGWNVYYITNISRPDAYQTTANSGGSWSNFSGAVASHIHQFSGEDNISYFASVVPSGQVWSGENATNSTLRSDLIELGGIPPSQPIITNPANTSYQGQNITITYQAAVSPNGYAIENYSIELLNSDLTYNKTIRLNNSQNLSWDWNITNETDEAYAIRVNATDNNSLMSSGISSIFTIAVPPKITIISPTNSTYNTTNILVNITATDTNLDSIWFDYGVGNTTYTSPINITPLNGVYTLIAYANDTNGNLNQTSVVFTQNATTFNVGLVLPANAGIGNTTQTFVYNVNLSSPAISCNLTVDGALQDQSDILASGDNGATIIVGPGIHSWYVSCNDTLITITTPTWIFQAGSTSGNTTIILSNSSQSFLSSPQSLFFNPNGNLDLFYFTNESPTNTLWYKSIENGILNTTFNSSLNATKPFLIGFRENNSLMFFSFSNDNATRFIYNITNSGLAVSSVATPYNVISNNYFDPMQYANTRNIQTINASSGSFFLYMLPTSGNNTKLIRLNYSSTTIQEINQTNKSTGVWQTISPIWQTIANDSTLTKWFYAFPHNSTSPSCIGNEQAIGIFSYNGTAQVELAKPRNGCYLGTEINTTGKVFFEQSGNFTYALIAGFTNYTTIYQIEGNKSYTWNASSLNPSQLMFISDDTPIFFSTESGTTYAYTCYFGGVSANCSRTPSNQYGAVVPFVVGPMTSFIRNGTSDLIVSGALLNNPVLELSLSENDYDVKYQCNNELNWSQRLSMTVSTLTNTTSVVLSTPIWGYSIPSVMIGNGTKQAYFTCYPAGVQRRLISGLNGNYYLNFYSLDNVSGAYYTFTVKDAYGQLVPGVLVSAYRYNTNTNTQVAIDQGISDFTGTVILYLQPFQPYTLVVTASGFTTISSIFTPGTNTNPLISLGSTGAQFVQMPNWQYEINDISYTITPVEQHINQTTNATFQISANNSDLQYFGMTVSRANLSTLIPVCVLNVTIQPMGGTVYCEMNQTGTYYLMPFYKVQNYSERNPSTVMIVFSNDTFFDSASKVMQTDQPISGWAYYAIALICAMIAGGWIMRYSVDGAGLAVIVVLWFFTFLNPNACLIPLTSNTSFDPSMAYPGSVCISPLIATTFTTIATFCALFLVKYL